MIFENFPYTRPHPSIGFFLIYVLRYNGCISTWRTVIATTHKFYNYKWDWGNVEGPLPAGVLQFRLALKDMLSLRSN